MCTHHKGLKEKPHIYISARRNIYKCSTIDVPFINGKTISIITFNLDVSLFQKGNNSKSQDYIAVLHYQKQLIRSVINGRIQKQDNIPLSKNYMMTTTIQAIEVINRRDDSYESCSTDDDDDILNAMATAVGCVPTYWKIRSNLPNCSNDDQYLNLSRKLQFYEETVFPCRSMEKLICSSVEKFELNGPDMQSMQLKFYFQPSLYKEITLARSYTFQSLIGNAGIVVINFNCNLKDYRSINT